MSESPDYLHIREIERELGLPLTPFPDWLPKVRVPEAIARDWNLTDPVISWAEAAEIYERGVSSSAPPESHRRPFRSPPAHPQPRSASAPDPATNVRPAALRPAAQPTAARLSPPTAAPPAHLQVRRDTPPDLLKRQPACRND